MPKLILFVVLFLAFISWTLCAPSKPHIIFIMVDDWGWANVGYHRYLHFTQEKKMQKRKRKNKRKKEKREIPKKRREERTHLFLCRSQPTSEVQTPNVDQLVAT